MIYTLNNEILSKEQFNKIKHLYKEPIKMENLNKYYTPSIEDIRVGYEYEQKSANQWEKRIVEYNWINKDGYILYAIKKNMYVIRTPYLTKEQIEKEGWEWNNIVNDRGEYSFHHTLSDAILVLRLNSNIVITDDNEHNNFYSTPEIIISSKYGHYNGKCKSINEFRTICNFLNIN